MPAARPAGQTPVFTAHLVIAGANPIYDGYVFGAEMDGALARVGFLGQQRLGSTTRSPAPA